MNMRNATCAATQTLQIPTRVARLFIFYSVSVSYCIILKDVTLFSRTPGKNTTAVTEMRDNFQGVVAAYVIQVGGVVPCVDTLNRLVDVFAGIAVLFYIHVDLLMGRLYSTCTSDLA